MQTDYIIVDFHKYCEKCKHNKSKETDSPCDECLDEPANFESDKPVKFEEKE